MTYAYNYEHILRVDHALKVAEHGGSFSELTNIQLYTMAGTTVEHCCNGGYEIYSCFSRAILELSARGITNLPWTWFYIDRLYEDNDRLEWKLEKKGLLCRL